MLTQEDGLHTNQDQDSSDEGLTDARSSEFQYWAASQRCSSPWTRLGSLRHANIVHFKFRCYDFRPHNRVIRSSMEKGSTSLYGVLSSSALFIPTKHLYQIATLWTTKKLATIPRLNEGNAVHASFYVQTYCDKYTWQITRVLNCLLWNRVASLAPERSRRSTVTHRPKHIYSRIRPKSSEIKDLEKSVLEIRNIHGRDSVSSALNSVSLILKRQVDSGSLIWQLLEETGLSENAVDSLIAALSRMRRRIHGRPRCTSCKEILWVDADPGFDLKSSVPGLELDKRNGDSTLAVRQPGWPTSTSMLCLFIIIEDGYDSEGNLHRLLQGVTDRRDFNAHKWGIEEWRAAKEWRSATRCER